MTLRYVGLPNINLYKSNVEQFASSIFGTPITLGAIAATWERFQPKLTLTNLLAHDKKCASVAFSRGCRQYILALGIAGDVASRYA
ncbi:MAG: hypothetical protein H7240_05485 [Glaciimonas sp.]|nr:hypothetical protein [Glaciimonas sp.]